MAVPARSDIVNALMTDALHQQRWLDPALRPTTIGESTLAELGVDVDALRGQRRPLTRSCPDRTERGAHLAGALGAALATHFLD